MVGTVEARKAHELQLATAITGDWGREIGCFEDAVGEGSVAPGRCCVLVDVKCDYCVACRAAGDIEAANTVV